MWKSIKRVLSSVFVRDVNKMKYERAFKQAQKN